MVCLFPLPEEQVACMEEFDQYIPPLWVMCLESVAHLLVMINFSTNFIIYCSVSAPFKKAFSKVKLLILCMAFFPNIDQFRKNFLFVQMKYCLLSEYCCFLEREIFAYISISKYCLTFQTPYLRTMRFSAIFTKN